LTLRPNRRKQAAGKFMADDAKDPRKVKFGALRNSRYLHRPNHPQKRRFLRRQDKTEKSAPKVA
jgi:hypothetical protein